MSRNDVERIRRGYEAFNEGGIEAVLDWLAPDIEVSDRQSVPDRETHHGVTGVWAFFQSTMEAFSNVHLEPVEFIERGDRVLVVLRQQARGRASGIELEGRLAHVWTMRDGTPVQLSIYRDKDAALEAL
jgi:ketosteroid isomerase-like protein